MLEQKDKILKKIDYLEKNQMWDTDIDDDVKPKTLLPNKVDYLNKKISSKILTKISNRLAINYFENEIKKGDFIIKDIVGIENYLSVSGGAIITCNHFSIYDHYTVYRAIKNYLPKGHNLYKVIKESNYTNFPGLFGFFFRHCNTLPLSSNSKTMMMFLRAVSELLKNGEKILIYPEQSLWKNYRKPRPCKNGAFKIATQNNVPIIPAFITMDKIDRLDAQGFNLQEYTLWFLPPIYPQKQLNVKENTEYLKEENYKNWVNLYEKVYGVPLTYEK